MGPPQEQGGRTVSISSGLARLRRRLTAAYRVRCARDDAARYGVRVPDGVWCCEDCRLVLWDRTAFVQHTASHAGAIG
jgi:hypothetical protein